MILIPRYSGELDNARNKSIENHKMILLRPDEPQHTEISEFVCTINSENRTLSKMQYAGAIFGYKGYANPLRVIVYVMNNGYYMNQEDFTLAGFFDSDVRYPFLLSTPSGLTHFSRLNVFEPTIYPICDNSSFTRTLSQKLFTQIRDNGDTIKSLLPRKPGAKAEIFFESIQDKFERLKNYPNSIEVDSRTVGSLFLTLCFLLQPFDIPVPSDKEACIKYFRSIWEGML